jgi:hypothetical protein
MPCILPLRFGSGFPPLRRPSAEQPVGELAVAAHVGEALLPPLEQAGQPLVVQPEQLQDCHVQVVDVDPVLDRPGVEREKEEKKGRES